MPFELVLILLLLLCFSIAEIVYIQRIEELGSTASPLFNVYSIKERFVGLECHKDVNKLIETESIFNSVHFRIVDENQNFRICFNSMQCVLQKTISTTKFNSPAPSLPLNRFS